MSLPLPQFPVHTSCTLCPLHLVAHSVGTPTIHLPDSLPPSPTTPAVVFLGMNPGYQEDQCGTPFVGPSGQLLKGPYITGIGLRSLATIYLTNAARCFHVEGDNPPASSFKRCFPHTLADLALIAPTCSELIVVCLGANAATNLHYFLGAKKVNLSTAFSLQGRQYPHPSTGHHLRIFSTFHPAYVLREHKRIHAVADHLSLLQHHLAGTSPSRSLPSFVPLRRPRRCVNSPPSPATTGESPPPTPTVSLPPSTPAPSASNATTPPSPGTPTSPAPPASQETPYVNLSSPR